MGLLVAKTGADMMSGDNSNVRADYDGRVRLASNNLFPDPPLSDFNESNGQHRYLELGAPPRPTHWAPYMRDKNKVLNSSRQVLAPLGLDQHTYDQEDELIHGPSPIDELKALAIAEPIAPDARAYMVSDTIGLPEGYYCIAWGYIPDDDWNSGHANVTNPGPRSSPFFLAQGQGFMLPTPTDLTAKIVGLALWITEPSMDANPVIAAQKALRAPMYLIDRWRVRGLDDFVRIVGPFSKRVEEEIPLSDKRNLTFVGDRRDMPKLKVREENTHHKHDERITVQVGYAFQTESGIGEVKTDGGWHKAQPGRRTIVFEPTDFEMRTDNEETHRERRQERKDDGKVDETKETNRDGEDEEKDARNRDKQKKKTERIKGWRPFVRFKATDDPDNPDDEHGVTEWYMIVDKGGKHAFLEKGENAKVMESEPGKWPKHGGTELVRVNIEEKDESGVGDPTEAPEAPEADLILDLNTSGLTPGKHWVKTSLWRVDADDEEETVTSKETEIDVDAGEGIRVRRPLWHNLADNEDASEADLEDYNKPLGWDYNKPFPSNVVVRNPKKGGVTIEDNSNATGTYWYLRGPVATLRNTVNRYIIRFNVSMNRRASGKLQAVLEEYDMVAGVPQFIAARVIKTWNDYVDDKTFKFMVSTNQSDPNNKNRIRLDANTKQVRIRWEGVGNTNQGVRNMDAEISQYGVFMGWGRPRKSKRLEVKRGETPEPKDTVYPHGGYCMVVDTPEDRPFTQNYTQYLFENFENNASFTSNWTTTSSGAVAGGRGQDYALHYDYGFRAAKTTQGASANYLITHTMAADRTQGSVVADFFVQTLNETGVVDMLILRTSTNTIFAKIGVNASNKWRLSVTDSAAATTTYTSAKGIDPGDLGTVELVVSGMNSTSGVVRAYASIGDGRRIELFNVTGINFTGMQWRNVRVGGSDSSNNALWDFYYDNIYLLSDVVTNVTYDAGNVIEYYGPYDTPKTSAYGPYGVRIPVKGGEEYTVALNVKTDDASNNTSLMRWRARTGDHRILETYDFVCKGIAGDTEWTRYDQTFTVPVGTAYIEWFENNVGAGTIYVHGIQIESGAVATPYDPTNALSGYLSVYFQTAPAGITSTDPMDVMALVDEIRSISANITTDAETSYSMDFRSGPSLGALGTYTTLAEELDKDHAYIEVRINLTSSSDTNSPELRRIEVDLARPFAHLLRGDGTEYEGAVLVNEINAEHLQRNVERVQFASGAYGDQTWGTVTNRFIPSMTILAFRPQTVEEITESHGDELPRLQTPYYRKTIRFADLPGFETNPATRIYLDSARTEYFQIYTATVGAYVEEEETF